MNISKFIETCNNSILKKITIEHNSDKSYALIYDLCKYHVDEVSKRSSIMIKHLIFENILNDRPLTQYLEILQLIVDALRHKGNVSNKVDDIQSSEKFDQWQELIDIVYGTENKFYSDEQDINKLPYNKEVEFAKSCKNLAVLGISFEYYEDDIVIKKESYENISRMIQDYINEIGGALILKYVFLCLEKKYEAKQERFHIFRRSSTMGEQIPPEVPWGYIIALGVKNLHVTYKHLGQKTIDKFCSFIGFMTEIVSTFEIQPYNIWEPVHVDPINMIRFLQENILYDNLISFFQLKSNYAFQLIDNVMINLESDRLEKLPRDLGHIVKVGVSIIQLSDNKNIRLISKSKISKQSSLPLNITAAIIDKIYSGHNNQNLHFPPSADEIEHVLLPLTLYQSQYVTLPKGITSLSVLNCILHQISKPNGIFDNANDSIIGKVIENFVWNNVKKRGIKCYRGDFESTDKKIKGDCDLLIKNDNCIFLFEIKKKALTRKAMSGVDFQIIKDLADSVMRSQSQCAKIEYVLLSDKKITLRVGSENETILYNNERIFKVSLSLHDFGALQDSTIFLNILRLSMQVDFEGESKEVSNMLKSWEKNVEAFKKYTIRSREFQKTEDTLYLDSMFMSVPQLLTILDESHNTDEFCSLCKGLKHVTFSTRCFYKEFSLSRKLYES